MDVDLALLRKCVEFLLRNTVLLYGFLVDLDPKAGTVRHLLVPAHHLDLLLQQMVTVEVEATDRRPSRVGEDRAEMSRPGRRQAVPHQLQPEGHPRLRAEGPLPHDRGFPPTDDVSVTYLLSDLSDVRR